MNCKVKVEVQWDPTLKKKSQKQQHIKIVGQRKLALINRECLGCLSMSTGPGVNPTKGRRGGNPAYIYELALTSK